MRERTRAEWERSLRRRGMLQDRLAWEEGMRRRFEELTGRPIAGFGRELEKEAAQGLMRFLTERNIAQKQAGVKPATKRGLRRQVARALGLGDDFVRQVTVNFGAAGLASGHSYTKQREIADKFRRITGRPLAAPGRDISMAAVRGVVAFLAEKHRNDAVPPSLTELSKQAADLLGTSTTGARALTYNLALPWAVQRGSRSHKKARLVAEAFKNSTGRELTREEIKADGGHVVLAAVRGIVNFAEQDRIGLPPERLAKTVGRALGIPEYSVYPHLRKIRLQRKPNTTETPTP